MASAAAGGPDQPVLIENDKAKSLVWKYFAYEANDEGKPKDVNKPLCKQCLKAVATKCSSTSNLAKHLKDRHPGLYGELQQVCKAPVFINALNLILIAY